MSKAIHIALTSKEFALPQGQGTLPVLAGCHFDLAAGEFGVLLGPSGCGKTTLLRLILGLDLDYEGTITCDDVPVRGLSSDRGIVFQEPRLLPWRSALKNVEFGLSRNAARTSDGRQEAHDLLKLVGLSGFEKRWPRELSGGMAQCVALARALVNVPSVLLLDEPFGALDTGTRAIMQDELLRIVREAGTTTILVTHDVDEALYLADKIVVFSARPGCVLGVHPVSLPHPRRRGDERLAELRGKLIESLFMPASSMTETPLSGV